MTMVTPVPTELQVYRGVLILVYRTKGTIETTSRVVNLGFFLLKLDGAFSSMQS